VRDKVPSSNGGVCAAQLNRYAPMRQVALCLLSLVAAAFAPAGDNGATDWEAIEAANRAARQKFSDQLPKLKTTSLLRIDPGATRRGVQSTLPRFHGWVVVASAPPSNALAESTISRSFARIVKSHDDGVAACFEPRHGLTLTDGNASFDVLLCFECWRYVVYTSDGSVMYADSFANRDEKEKWEQVFIDAGLPGTRRK
jgi:hypothetical protein